MAQPDQVRTLFFWGFAVEEKLAERLALHKRSGKAPLDVLPFPLQLEEAFSRSILEEALRLPRHEVPYKVVPGGRELTGGVPEAPELRARYLAAALLPLADSYPIPLSVWRISTVKTAPALPQTYKPPHDHVRRIPMALRCARSIPGLLRMSLAPEESRAYWEHVRPDIPPDQCAVVAFEERWFGNKSMARVRELLATFRQRFDAYPMALEVLRHWRPSDPATRLNLCHWHMQLTDPLYRAFTGSFSNNAISIPSPASTATSPSAGCTRCSMAGGAPPR